METVGNTGIAILVGATRNQTGPCRPKRIIIAKEKNRMPQRKPSLGCLYLWVISLVSVPCLQGQQLLPESLSLQDAVRLALERNPVAASREHISRF